MRRVLALLLPALLWAAPLQAADPGFAGSQSCRDCHEKFYQLWSTSHHGLAMQSFDAARAALRPQAKALAVQGGRFQMDLAAGVMLERGPSGEKRYPVVQALGGKNVFYFLTPLTRGRLQTLPLAYDLNTKEWFDTAAGGVRHVPG